MTLLEAIDVRCSRRKYLDRPMEPGAARALSERIAAYARSENLRLELVLDNGTAFAGIRRSYGMFTGVRNYIGLIDNKADLNCLEKLGYWGEMLTLHATALGLGTCWVGGTFDKALCPFTLSEGESVAAVITVGHVPEALGLREKLIHTATHRKTKSIEAMSTADNPPAWFTSGIRAVQKAPSAVMHQPVHFTLADGVVTASVPDISYLPDVLDFGIAKLHFELGAGGGKWDLGNGGAFHPAI